MTDAHHTRSHSAWAASATARNTTCSGAMAMATLAGEEKESEAAAWGTACHQVAHKCFDSGRDASSFVDTIEKTESHEFIVDEEMANCAAEFVDYCIDREREYVKAVGKGKGVAEEHLPMRWTERNFSLASLRPPFDAGGTGDRLIYFPLWKMLEIVDLKGGRGVVVEVRNNAQARTYGLGAMLEFQDLDVEVVRSTIVQSRAPHKDGRIRSEEIHVADLVDWTGWLLDRMRRSKAASDVFPGVENRMLFDDWAEAWLTTGACQFCRAEGFCPKRRKEALAVAGKKAAEWFETPGVPAPVPTNAPSISSVEELGHTLNGLEALESWIKAVRSHAHSRAERGEKIPGWVLADRIGNRVWMSDDDGVTLGKLALQFKVKPETFLDQPTLKSVAQVEKALGSCKAELAKLEGKLWHKPKKGTNLVSAEKTTRAPAKSKPEQHFEALTETEKQ